MSQYTRCHNQSFVVIEATCAFKINDDNYGIFDTFETDDARNAHLGGQIPTALAQVAPDLLASPPNIRTVDVVAVK